MLQLSIFPVTIIYISGYPATPLSRYLFLYPDTPLFTTSHVAHQVLQAIEAFAARHEEGDSRGMGYKG